MLKIDKVNRRPILKLMNEKVPNLEDPTSIAKALKGNYKGLYRFRAGDYRVICDVQHERILVLVLDVGHRKDVY